MRKAKTISDVAELLKTYEVKLVVVDNEVLVEFPDSENFPGCMIVPEPSMTNMPDINAKRISSHIIRRLTSSKQFWRVTTVANQLTIFGSTDAGKVAGILSIRKKAGSSLTIALESGQAAREFVSATV